MVRGKKARCTHTRMVVWWLQALQGKPDIAILGISPISSSKLQWLPRRHPGPLYFRHTWFRASHLYTLSLRCSQTRRTWITTAHRRSHHQGSQSCPLWAFSFLIRKTSKTWKKSPSVVTAKTLVLCSYKRTSCQWCDTKLRIFTLFRNKMYKTQNKLHLEFRANEWSI